MKKILAILMAATLIFSSCTKENPTSETAGEKPSEVEVIQEETVKLYYPDENADGLVSEECEVEEKTPEAALEALFNGPYTETSAPIFGEGTRLLGFELVAGEAKVDVSGKFLQSTGDSLAIYSVVNTLTEFEDISFVRITVEGSENAVLGNYILSEDYTRNEALTK